MEICTDAQRRLWLSFGYALPVMLLSMTIFIGCQGKVPEFAGNAVHAEKLALESGGSIPEQGISWINDALEELFGTPDRPTLPEPIASQDIDLQLLTQAAGPVFSDESDNHFGLYRKHCFRCHGLTGDGKGPAARLLDPYPRDFRVGKFKYKSTPIGIKPTKEDLTRILREGIPGTSMPSFRLLREVEIAALVDYVIYLSSRGETERELLHRAAFDVDWRMENPSQSQGEQKTGDGDEMEDASGPIDLAALERLDASQIANEKIALWRVTKRDLPPRPTSFPLWTDSDEFNLQERSLLQMSIERGSKLFRSPVAACSKCHGEDAGGGVFVKDYDDWTKEWTSAVGLDPEDRTSLRPLVKVGALKPVPISARNLRWAVFRGGSTPDDLYYRIVHGIEGTPMPAAALESEVEGGLTTDQVWDLVNYLYSFSDPSRVIEKKRSNGTSEVGGRG
jgi:mono/diheme cytochrome c family protein